MIIFMGIAGAGKGTQSKLLAEERNWACISTGEIFRAAVADGKYPDYFKGKLISDEETTELLTEALRRVEPGKEVILDGFPRNVSQTKWLLSESGEKHCGAITLIHLLISKEVTLERLKLRHRIDDTEEAIHQRFKDYDSESGPIVALFEKHGTRICNINADQTVEQVHQSILQCLAKDDALIHENKS
jgi:adenylate kinase